MKLILKTAISFLSAAGVCLLLIYCGLIPPGFLDWLDQVAAREAARQTVGGAGDAVYGAGTSGRDPARGVAVETSDDVFEALSQGLDGHAPTVAMNLAISPGTDLEPYMMQMLEAAFLRVRRERPDIFWVSMGSYEVAFRNMRDHCALTVELRYCCDADEAAEKRHATKAAADLVAGMAPAGGAEAAAWFHDWIVANTVYDTGADMSTMEGMEYAANIDGVFLDGKAVCEGYAKAFKLLCDRADIPCLVILGSYRGESHAWNYVQLDGRWYLVDCTADDPLGNRDATPRREYFLRGSTGNTADGTVEELYIPDSGDYPVLNPTSYGEPD